jgi:hypothetical protein
VVGPNVSSANSVLHGCNDITRTATLLQKYRHTFASTGYGATHLQDTRRGKGMSGRRWFGEAVTVATLVLLFVTIVARLGG